MTRRPQIARLGPIALLHVLSLGCAPDQAGVDPAALPAKLVEETVTTAFFPRDLDNDGFDERVGLPVVNVREGRSEMDLLQNDGTTIDQVNLVRATVGPRPFFLDWDRDGYSDILLSTVVSDSLFLQIVDRRGRKLDRMFVAAGSPRQDPDGPIPWYGEVRTALVRESDDPAGPTVVVGAAGTVAGPPRGVWRFSPGDGRLVDHVAMAPIMNVDNAYLSDFDGDGAAELLFSASSSDNGVSLGGYDDAHSYVGLVAWPRDSVRLRLEPVGPETSQVRIYPLSHPHPDSVRYVAVVRSSRTNDLSDRLMQIDPAAPGRLGVRSVVVPRSIWAAGPCDLDRDGREELLVIGRDGWMELVSADLERYPERAQLRKEWLGHGSLQAVRAVPDIDGDGIDEIFVSLAAGTAVLGPDLEIRAFSPIGGSIRVVHRGRDRQRAVVINTGAEQSHVMELLPNRSYLYIRFRRPILTLFGVVALLFLFGAAFRYHRTHRVIRDDLARQLRQVRADRERLEAQLAEARQAAEQLRSQAKSAGAGADAPRDGRDGASHLVAQAAPSLLVKTHEIVARRYQDPRFGVGELAELLGCHPRTLERVLRARLDTTPSELLQKHRLERAAELLRADTHPARIGEIAYRVGFRSPKTFSAQFKSVYGVTPSQFRKRESDL